MNMQTMEQRRGGSPTMVTADDLRAQATEYRAMAKELERIADRMEGIQPHDILSMIARRFGVSVEKMLSRDRTHHVAFVRQVACYTLREYGPQTGQAPLSFPKIGEMLRRDHSSVIHSCDLVKAMLATRPALRIQIESMMADLRARYRAEETIAA